MNRTLLAEIAGLELRQPNDDPIISKYVFEDMYHKNNKPYCHEKDWLPDEKVEQALLLKSDDWDIEIMIHDDQIQVTICTFEKQFKKSKYYEPNEDIRPIIADLICKAVLEAEK